MRPWARRWADRLLLLALALLPLHRPLIHDSPHIGVGDLFAGPALALSLLTMRLPRAAWIRVGVLVAALTPSVAWAADRPRAALKLCGLVYVLLLSGAAMALGERRQRDGLFAIVVGAALACALGLVMWERYPWMALPRPVGSTESPSMLSMIALAGLFALRAAHASADPALGRRWLRVSLTALFWLTLVAAQSRILLAAIIGVAIDLDRGPRRRALVALAVLGALALFSVSLVWRVVPPSTTPPFIDTHPSPYAVCHEVAWRAFAAHPFAGVGLHGFHAAWPRYVDPVAAAAAFSPLPPAPLDPHGTLQGYLAEAGLPALLLLAFLAIDLWRRRGSAGYWVALVVASFTLDLLSERSSWALLGLISGGYHWPSDSSTKR